AADGVPVVITSHQIELMQALASDVAILHKGRMAAAGPMAAMLKGRLGGFDVVLGDPIDPIHGARLREEFPHIEISGKRISVREDEGALHAVLGRLQCYPLVSVQRAAP